MSDEAWAAEPVDPARSPGTAVVPLMSERFTAATVTALRHAVETKIAAAGLAGDRGFDFVLAVHELVTNAVRHGGGHGYIDLRRENDVLVCEVTDYGMAADHLPMRLPAIDVVGGRGLWLARQLSDELVLTRRPDGVTAMVAVCLEPLSSPHIRTASAAPRNDRRSSPGEDKA